MIDGLTPLIISYGVSQPLLAVDAMRMSNYWELILKIKLFCDSTNGLYLMQSLIGDRRGEVRWATGATDGWARCPQGARANAVDVVPQVSPRAVRSPRRSGAKESDGRAKEMGAKVVLGCEL